jgi:hypothetical protein
MEPGAAFFVVFADANEGEPRDDDSPKNETEFSWEVLSRVDCGVALSALSAACVGCASARDGYLYDAKAGRKGSFRFDSANAKQGSVLAELANGERCAGQFNAVASVVQLDQETGRVDREEAQTGLAVLECNAGHLVRCAFERDHAGDGSGRCSDTAGQTFELYF